MLKNAVISARIEDGLKKKVESILRKLGISPTEAITIFYKQVELQKGLPFDVKLPNETTQKALRDSTAKKNLKKYKNSKELYNDLGI